MRFKGLFNKVKESKYFGGAIIFIIICLVPGIGFELVTLDIARIHLPWMWILYIICWIFAILVVILIVKADKEKYTVIIVYGFGLYENPENELKGIAWVTIVWSIVAGGLLAYLIPTRICGTREILVLFAAWMLIVGIAFGYYLSPPNPSGNPQNRPRTTLTGADA